MKLTIPTELSEITLGQLQSISVIEGSDLEATERQKKIVSLLTGVDRKTIDLFRLSDLQHVYEKLLYLSKQDNRLTKFVTIDGVKYGFHPNLSNISTGEFADLDSLCQDFNENLHLIMSVLYRPVILEKLGKYQIKPYEGEIEERGELFKNKMPANIVNGALVFFWTLGNDYLKNTQEYSEGEQEATSNSSSRKDGGGIPY
jgi:hypothetical protein